MEDRKTIRETGGIDEKRVGYIFNLRTNYRPLLIPAVWLFVLDCGDNITNMIHFLQCPKTNG